VPLSFQKWSVERKHSRLLSIAARYFWEDRWGGEMQWTKAHRGGGDVYGESIYTKRWELIGNYQLPFKEKVLLAFSYNDHNQDSRYGTTSYIAQQRIAFSQITWDKTLKQHDLLAGAALRYTFYDDNTPATAAQTRLSKRTAPTKYGCPVFLSRMNDTISRKHKLLLGFRYDYNPFMATCTRRAWRINGA
jgi:outer membrane receptor for ferrienterochelin and colicins